MMTSKYKIKVRNWQVLFSLESFISAATKFINIVATLKQWTTQINELSEEVYNRIYTMAVYFV